MDLEEQKAIQQYAEQYGSENLLVVLGAPDAETSETYAETVTNGDPTFAGPLAGISLRIPAYHILEEELKVRIDPTIYEEQVGMMSMVLDKDSICSKVSAIRNSVSE